MNDLSEKNLFSMIFTFSEAGGSSIVYKLLGAISYTHHFLGLRTLAKSFIP
jgi:hypothetical protein